MLPVCNDAPATNNNYNHSNIYIHKHNFKNINIFIHSCKGGCGGERAINEKHRCKKTEAR